ncbi:YciI family protein [Pseudoxanthobacter sp.]|uniref:YciI family protein n=1 Tax=Pseudoxanthobacter sp. TaxID=1925742 RepID=UPI002FE42BF9
MFVVTLTYKVPLAEIEAHLEEHVAFLERRFADGTLIAAGRRVPRTGGVILARGDDEAALRAVLAEDPFVRFDLAEVALTAFTTTRAAEGFTGLVGL